MAFVEVTNIKRTPTPEWAKDLIIYEISPRAFTSPSGAGDGSGSGTLKSAMEKLEYIRELGATAVWLAGYQLSTHHFSDFWTCYALKDPRVIDPHLGTEEDLKAFVERAHELGLFVLGEAVTHGLTPDNPVILEHPEWFSGKEWGMPDFDYGNRAFCRWWTELWTGIALKYDFDGFRLDGPNGVSPHHQVMKVWDEIAFACREKGKELLIMGENTRYHIRQNDFMEFSHRMAEEFSPEPRYATMQISSHDEGIMMAAGNYYALRGSRFKFGYSAVFGYNIPLFFAGEEFNASAYPLPAVKKAMFDGYETDREVEFFDGNPGTDAGGWLYGNQIDWSELEKPEHREMYEDCRQILHIRQENRDILHYDRRSTHILPVRCAPKSGSIPYVRYSPGEKAILIVGNETVADHDFILQVPLTQMGLEGFEQYRVTDLWTGDVRILEEKRLACLQVSVPGDYKKGGGVRAVRIEPVKGVCRWEEERCWR